MRSILSGIATLVIGRVTNTSFTMPKKYNRKQVWENTGLAWTVFAPVDLPVAAAR
jgi:hypothetical protein